MAKRHKDVNFEVDRRSFTDFSKAAEAAVVRATSGSPVNLDVIIWSKAGARAWGGDDAVDAYNEDPEASVFERIVIKVDVVGRVP